MSILISKPSSRSISSRNLPQNSFLKKPGHGFLPEVWEFGYKKQLSSMEIISILIPPNGMWASCRTGFSEYLQSKQIFLVAGPSPKWFSSFSSFPQQPRKPACSHVDLQPWLFSDGQSQGTHWPLQIFRSNRKHHQKKNGISLNSQ